MAAPRWTRASNAAALLPKVPFQSMVPAALPPELIAHVLSFLKPSAEPSLYPAADATTLELPSAAMHHTDHLRDYCNCCLLSRDILPYARQLLYRTLVLGNARQVRLLARTLEGHDARSASPNRDFEQAPFNMGSLIHPEMMLALSPMKMTDAATETPSNVGALADGLGVSSNGIRQAAQNIARYIQHVCITHNDGYLASGDTLSDTYAWAPGLRTLFTHAVNLEMLSLVSRPNGAAIEQLVNPKTRGSLKCLTVQSLSYSALPFIHKPDPRLFRNLTHLHLIQTVPRKPLLKMLVDSETCCSPLQVLRLSRVYHDGLDRLEESLNFIEKQRPMDESLISGEHADAGSTEEYQIFLHGRSSNATKLQVAIHLLMRNLVFFPCLRLLLLELGEMGALDPPPPPTQRFANMTGTPGEQFVSSVNNSATATGQLATLDFPSDVPLSFDEATAWDQEEERRRTANRDEYWLNVREGKEALKEFAAASLKHVFNNEIPFAEGREPAVRRRPDQGLEVRVVAPRPGGWNRFESQADFDAQVPDANWSCTEERTSYNDPDVFELAEKRWDLGYAPFPDASIYHSHNGKAAAPKYWLGTLPRVKASDGVVSQSGVSLDPMQR
ncbi:hypothetical protein K437DRAFT_254276 [Tilletiaria anomala UBC 951]|uniref:F-box domain-containing protein n=1 Tax=Tilletiaria anomala (strain ATCC 24038 / CBS 436.72 / UBC 951) TaxID=1037660 RepID=A0A066WPD6_TILAU|nr:uncharacterized protein K437DRAFT_254276 [Tilletiaria anomala UBC 951]KDN52490.1 hypothetical protein K437DRAFT_254276 [Tilletiaria anomala UBC 951]